MARASTPTLLSLDRFFQIVGMHPLHANSVEIEAARMCGSPLLQYPWQHADSTAREDIALAISTAEQMMEDWLGFSPAPRWYVDERDITGLGGLDITGRGAAAKVRGGYIIAGGVEAKVLLSSGAPVVYTDADGDVYKETATITVAGLPTYVTQPEEVAIYYPGHSGDNVWEIRPTRVTISGATATITCSRHQLVEEVWLEQLSDARAVGGLDDTKFLETVDVYRHYHDPQRQIQFLWEGGCSCGCDSGCSYSTQWGCMLVRNNRLGLVSAAPADWSASSLSFTSTQFSPCRYPDRGRLWYRAGFRDMGITKPNFTMAAKFERAVTYYALGLLGRPICGCNAIKEISQWWAYDLAATVSTAAASVSNNASRRLLDNPFGTTRGAVYAWNIVRESKLGESVIHA